MDFAWRLGACSRCVRLSLHNLLALVTLTLSLVCAACTAGPAQKASSAASSAPAASAAAPTTSPQASSDAPPAASSLAPSAAPELPAGSVVPEIVAKGTARAPFVVLLHGYGGTGASIARHFGFATLAAQKRFVYLAPDGTPDSKNARFWAAGGACCDFDGKHPDHIGALAKAIADARANPRVDPARVFVVGFSNGGFMAHRLACEVEGIAGVVSVAGAVSFDPGACKFAPKVVIQVHGDADPVVRFEGGRVLGKTSVEAHPGALAGVTGWAKRLGCVDAPAAGKPFDLDAELPGAETTPYTFGCSQGVTLLKVAGGEHDIASNPAAMSLLLDRLTSLAASP